MNARLVFVAGAVLSVPAALLVMIAQTPSDTTVSWPVYLAGFAALVAAAIQPRLLSGRWTVVAVTAAAVAGTGLGLLVQRTEICCMFVVSQLYGYPYPWIVRHADYEALEPIEPPPTFAQDAELTVRALGLMVGVWYWVCAALAVVALIRAAAMIARRA